MNKYESYEAGSSETAHDGATVGKIRPPLIPIVSGPRRATVGMHWLSFQMFNRILKRVCHMFSSNFVHPSTHLPLHHELA